MVSIGTIFTLGIIGAVIAGSYAVYRNSGKIGGALSRGVETNLTNPLGNYFDNLWQGANANLQTTTGGPIQQTQQQAAGTDPTPGILDTLPTATAQTPTGNTGITPQYANELTNTYLQRAQKSAKTAFAWLSPQSQTSLIKSVEETALASPTPLLTQSQLITDKIRVSVGGSEPLTNKFYQLFNLNNTFWKGTGESVIPLSKESVLSYSKLGVIAREVYL